MADYNDIIRNVSAITEMNKRLTHTKGIFETMEKVSAFSNQQKKIAIAVNALNNRTQINEYYNTFSTLDPLHNLSRNFLTNPYLTKALLPNHKIYTSVVNYPSSAFENIFSIIKSTIELNKKIDAITAIGYKTPPFYSSTGIQFSLNKLSAKITAFSTASNDFDLLEIFNRVNEQAITLSETLEDNDNRTSILNEIIKYIVSTAEQLYSKIGSKRSKKALAILSVTADWLSIISFVLALVALHDKNVLTKQDLQNVKVELTKQIAATKTIEKKYHFTNRKCPIYINANKHSLKVGSLKPNYAVSITATNHKWVYVSYNDLNDGLPKSGWIIKKYLSAEK